MTGQSDAGLMIHFTGVRGVEDGKPIVIIDGFGTTIDGETDEALKANVDRFFRGLKKYADRYGLDELAQILDKKGIRYGSIGANEEVFTRSEKVLV